MFIESDAIARFKNANVKIVQILTHFLSNNPVSRKGGAEVTRLPPNGNPQIESQIYIQASFSFIFGLYQNKHNNFIQQINTKNVHPAYNAGI